MQLKVWILNHTWDDGGQITVHPSRAAAKHWVWEYVREQWNEGPGADGECPMPLDPEEAVDTYFDGAIDYEWYSIQEQVVDFPDLPELANEEVILDSDECASVIALIDYISPDTIGFVSAETGMSKDNVKTVFNNVYQKLKD